MKTAEICPLILSLSIEPPETRNSKQDFTCMYVVVVIPARYGSTRLPGKLVLPEAKELTGKYIIEHVYARVSEARLVNKVVVATDDRRIFRIVRDFGGDAEMTPDDIRSGTDRAAWLVENVASVSELKPDVVVNVQGDEPDITGTVIDSVISMLCDDDAAVMSTVAVPISSAGEYNDPHAVKVVIDNNSNALYFSRAPIPFAKDGGDMDSNVRKALKHIGLYAFRREFLLKFPTLPVSCLEGMEGLEQLRVISNGFKIKVAVVEDDFTGVDTREDFETFLDKYRQESRQDGSL